MAYEVAGMYMAVSEQHIMPGLKMLSKLSVQTATGGQDAEELNAEVSNYVETSKEGVKTIIQTVRSYS